MREAPSSSSRRAARRLASAGVFALAAAAAAPGLRAGPEEAASAKPDAGRIRLIIETDAGGDPDDEQSLVRFLLYTNEWDVEGIIANRPRARDGENLNTERTGPGIVRRLLDAYAACWPSLFRHDPRYPEPAALRSRTVAGHDGIDDGVDLLIAAADRPDPRPLWYSDWGTDRGAAVNNLLRALDRVRRERGQEGYARFKSRFRLSSHENFGEHTTLEPPFPLWVDTFRPERDGKRWYHRFSALTARAGGFDLERDMRSGHGPLGALYPTNTTHPQKEGDTMTFLYLVPTGMNDPAEPGWGSWAGRYGRNQDYAPRNYFWANQEDAWRGTTNRDNTLARWAEALQNDFRARLEWCVKPPAEANHPPAVRVRGPLRRAVAPGERVVLDASASNDPDGDRLTYRWELYPEAGDFTGPLAIDGADSARASFVAPPVEERRTLHVILTATDAGAPPLSRHARAVVTVDPAAAAAGAPAPANAPDAGPDGKRRPGLAARYPGDAGIERDPAVLLAEDFEADALDDVLRRWTEVSNRDRAVLSLSNDRPEGSPGRRSLLSTATIGKDTGGHLYRRLPREVETVHARFYVKFAPENGYTHHFVTVGGYRPATAWPQGKAGERPRGDDRITVGIEPFAEYGREPPPGAWAFYTYWHEMKISADGRHWGNGLRPARPRRVPRDTWQCVEVMVKLNSKPEAADGELALWLDGELAARFQKGVRRGDWTGMGFSLREEGGEPFEGFRWRTSPELKLNFFWLLHYVTEGVQRRGAGANSVNRVWFDHIVVAEEPIGPLARPPGDR